MTTYVAFLRAVNAGGTRVMEMDKLRKTFDWFGLANVQTFIQSGNVIFESRAPPTLEARIEKGLEKALGYKIAVFVRSMEEIGQIVNQTELKPKENETHRWFSPAKSQSETLTQFDSTADELRHGS